MAVVAVLVWPRMPCAHADLTISLDGECPGWMVLSWQGAVPDRWAVIAVSPRRDEWIMPWGGPCGGTTIELSPPYIVRTFRTDSDGRGTMEGTVRNRYCGLYVQMIVADGQPCQTSNVLQIQ